MLAVEIGFIVLAAAALVPVALLLLEILAAIIRPEAANPIRTNLERRVNIAVLIPAHNEASIIAETVAAVRSQLVMGDRILVVADNCTDETAVVAGREGAEVIARTDMAQRGKGFALDCGIRRLSESPPDVVIVIDADCQPGLSCVDRLAFACQESGRPVQARYLMRAKALSSPRMKIAEFAWLVKNRVRPLGMQLIGAPTHLMGSGMAFPWPLIRDAQLASGHIVEDLKLGIDLACAGSAAIYCDAAWIDSDFPLTAKDSTTQRTRWEHGHLHVIGTEAPRMLWIATKKMDPGLFLLAIDLCIPPLVLLLLAIGFEWVIGLALLLATGRTVPLIMSSVTLAFLLSAILLPWVKFGRHIVSAGELAAGFGYVLMKIPVYLKFLVARQVTWVRAKRDK